MADEIAPDLMLRGIANLFFDRLERKRMQSLVLDFDGVRSISRSFAHQYVLRKRKTEKSIREINVSPEVAKMLQLVGRQMRPNSYIYMPPMSNPQPIAV